MDIRNSKPVEQIVAAIAALDLDPIKVKLMDAEEGQGWSREQVDGMAVAYKRFLTLLVKYPETPIAPSKDVDKFWHGHILDTMKYAQDCEIVFGYFLHHFPYFGMRGEEDAAALAEAGKQTAALYEKEFGENVPHAASYCGAAKPAYCGVATTSYCGAAKPAYCGVATKAAYCGAAKPAYCGVATKAAYCGAAKPAYCGVATKPAYCGAAKPAYCGVATKAVAQPSYCGAANQASAYCGASVSANFDATTRPTLARAA